MEQREQLRFTFEEAKSMDIRDIDGYTAAGVSTEIDCSVLGYPPAGPIYPNSFHITFLCIDALRHINMLLAQGKREDVWLYIQEGQERIKEWEKSMPSL